LIGMSVSGIAALPSSTWPGGAQPMEVEEADHMTVALIYTGEVYNFMELRD
jgi:asparagine synthetase B (glutamine-hydrolysing)